MGRYVWILTKKDYKEIFTNPVQLLIVMGYLIFFNIIPLISLVFREVSSVEITIFSVGLSAIFPVLNVLVEGVSKEQKNRVLDLLLTKISPLTICINKLVTSISMSVIFVIFSLIFQLIINKLFSPDFLNLLYYMLDKNVFVLTFQIALPVILLISSLGLIISIFLDTNIRMYGLAVLLLIIFGSIRLLLVNGINILTGEFRWISIVIWLMIFLSLFAIYFLVDKEKMLKS
jgi:hypothetical protein